MEVLWTSMEAMIIFKGYLSHRVSRKGNIVKKPYNKKKRARVLLVAILLAIAVCAGALACFNATLKRGEKNKTRESVAEWTQQNARLLQYKMDRYYDTLENVARSVQNLPMNSQESH